MTRRPWPEIAPLVLVVVVLALVPACAGRQAAPETAAEAAGAGAATAGEPAAAAATGDVPFRLELRPFTVEGLPGLHSMVAAGEPGELLLAGGRTNGLHGFAPSREAAVAPSFPRASANDVAYVVDLPGRRLLGQAKVTGLPDPYDRQLVANNTQYLLEDGFLYVAGGYGPDPQRRTLVTLPLMTAVDFARLVAAIRGGTPLDAAFAAAHMAMAEDLRLAVTGGDLETLAAGGDFLLVYGQRFDGEYTPGGGQVQQEYTNQIRVFDVAAGRGPSGVGLTVGWVGGVPDVGTGMDPDNPFHRRDLGVSRTVDPAGRPRLGVYGGVFKGGRMEGYLHPIYVTPGATAGLSVTEDTAAEQLLSQYDCPVLQLWSSSRQAVYSTFFGGISQYWWDPSCPCLRRDPVDLNHALVDGLPFVDSVSTFRVDGSGSAQFLHVGERFPPPQGAPQCAVTDGDGGTGSVAARFLGTETKLVPAPGVPRAANGVIDLDAVTGRTVVGWLVGGIAAWCPEEGDSRLRCYASTQGGSCASNVVYEVTLNPNAGTPSRRLEAPAP